mgnify:CR=1 FL=1
MKFYVDDKNYISYYNEISNNKLTAIYHYKSKNSYVQFFKNGMYHNPKNADYINNKGFKDFSLNNKFYGYDKDFTKQSWRRFVKMKVFL